MVQLPARDPLYMVPPYSLTGDLLSFKACGLQYRYLNGSALPPSRPVQLWFGEFIHGVLELAIRYYQEGMYGALPWAEDIVEGICDIVATRLASQGKTPRSQRAEQTARARTRVGVNELGAILFPLVATPEVALSGTRLMPSSSRFRAEYYEVTGRIDVLTNIEIGSVQPGVNQIVDLITDFLPHQTSDPFEVIVDYKGMRRPRNDSGQWLLYEWQLQTYAWLRQKQPGSLPVRAGMIIFINELWPGARDLQRLNKDISDNATDVRPANGTEDLRIVLRGPRGEAPYGLTWPFRLSRAIRLVKVEEVDQDNALARFDGIVEEIEACVAREVQGGRIRDSWPTNPEPQYCVACDFRTGCPMSDYRGPAVAPLGRLETTPYTDDE